MNIGDLASYSGKPWFISVMFETIIGVFMNFFCLARFVGMLPAVQEKDYGKKSESDCTKS